ncbi:patatin-like phospholipase family protein [Herbaspirillum sp. WKF16]|jgi:predicted acylesterase/phospholipase RssA|uniref:patatin-like phospholipase family protein n=1 Tax=Herbaspirillum sp. WKF16 TaxID=3028312 RepID=UPI0023A9D822|nr:patatin-like phospholipase family protein [Herbaspirillum sp. WKF16]WDZ94455.1 patatin-like phospholipase family protein [Herbaspirillum sp. WKF16]
MGNPQGQGKKALVIGGGAPNSTLIAGALAAFLAEGIEFDVISASGAGVLMGLLYTAPRDASPREALMRWAEVGVADSIYKLFPVNYKVFKKPGSQAESYRDSVMAQMQKLPTLGGNPFADMFTQHFADASAKWNDWMHLMMSAMSPSDLNSGSLGLCAHLPFLEQSIDFDAVARMRPEFYINAYNIERQRMQIWNKDEITPAHVRASLSFPFLYAPTEIGGENYIEGAALDTLNFDPFIAGRDGAPAREADVDTLVVLDILGEDRLIRKPRNLYDAWVRSIITPLVKISKAEQRLFELEHNTDPATGKPLRKMLKVDLMKGVPEQHWPQVLDWSATNMQLLFDVGYQAGLEFCRTHGDALGAPLKEAPLAA